MSNIYKEHTWDFCIARRPKKPYLEFNQLLAKMAQIGMSNGPCLHNYQEVEYFGEDKDSEDSKNKVSVICIICNATYCSEECFPKQGDPELPGGCAHKKSPVPDLVLKPVEVKPGNDEPSASNWDFDSQYIDPKSLDDPTLEPVILEKLPGLSSSPPPAVFPYQDEDVDIIVAEKEVFGKHVADRQLDLGQTYLMKVVCVESPSEFYMIPFDGYEPDLAVIKSKCKPAGKRPSVLENPEVNNDCLCWVQDDDWNQTWFRARIVHILPESVVVRLLDVGGRRSVLRCDIRHLPLELCEVPGLAVRGGFQSELNFQIPTRCNVFHINHFRRLTKDKCCKFVPTDEGKKCVYGILTTYDGEDIYRAVFKRTDEVETVHGRH